MRFFVHLLIFVLATTAVYAGEGTPSCERAVLYPSSAEDSSKAVLAERGELYRVQFVGDPVIRTLRYRGVESSGEKELRVFTDGSGKNQVTHKLPRAEIGAWREYYSGSNTLKRGAYGLGEQVLSAHIIGKVTLRPYRQFAQKESATTVFGGVTGSKAKAEKIADQLQSFDRQMLAMGFDRPKSTRVILPGKVMLPSLAGPASISEPLFNLWSANKGPASSLVMDPFLWKKGAVDSESILCHERAHLLFGTTYDSAAYVNRNDTVQEALADFSSAHVLNSPELGSGLGGKDLPMRNVESGLGHWGSLTDTRRSVLDLEEGTYHENSMMISRLLWKLRGAVGAQVMSLLYKELVDNLNGYRDSYDLILKQEGRSLSKETQRVAYDLEYLLAVILKSSEQWSTSAEVDAMLRSSCTELSFSMERINEVAARLSLSGKDYSYTGKGVLKEMIIGKIQGLIGAGSELLFIVWASGLF